MTAAWASTHISGYELKLKALAEIAERLYEEDTKQPFPSLKSFASQPESERLENSYHNAWFLLGTGLFFCAVSIDNYLNERFPSAKSGFLAQFNPGRRDFKNPLVKLNLVVGILCLISLTVGFLQTFAKP